MTALTPGVFGVPHVAQRRSTAGLNLADLIPATPSVYDDEFEKTESSDPLTGWTTLGSFDAISTNSVPSHLRLQKNATGALQIHGIHKTAPPMPFTVTMKLTDMLFYGNYQTTALMLTEATPGKLFVQGILYGGGRPNFGWSRWTNRTTRATWGGDLYYDQYFHGGIYLRLVVTASNSVVGYASQNGLAWHPLYAAADTGLTVANVGICISGQDNSVPAESLVDWIRFS